MQPIEAWQWVFFSVLVVILLTLDLLVFHRHDHAPSMRESAGWTVFWVSLGLAFNALVWWWDGSEAGITFLGAFLMEKALSMDNIFVFVVIFRFFRVPTMFQYRVLFWGILGAVVMRLGFILGGVELIQRFSWVKIVFGAFLIYTAYKLILHSGAEVHPENNIVLKIARKFLPVAHGDHRHHGHSFFVREDGRLRLTPMFMVLLVIESTDVIFAVDSVPAVIGIIPPTYPKSAIAFLAFTSNVFAILGLRALYFLLGGMVEAFRYLHYGLAAVLGFVGIKMLTEHWLEGQGIEPLAPWVSVIVIVALIGISVAASVLVKKEPESKE
jgi:tellurite resistance protein TerC